MKFIISLIGCCYVISLMADIIPTSNANNFLYYQIGGSQDFNPPPVTDTTPIPLTAGINLGLGFSCGVFNPATAIANSLNNLKDSVDNLEQAVIQNATGSLAEMPMYFLAEANPTAYNLINNALIKAHADLSVSVKSCNDVKAAITSNQNPYQNWATLAIGNQWKEQLSLASNNSNVDINSASQTIAANSGNDGLPWVNGNAGLDGSLHAGGINQPPIHVISDTVVAGYNALLNRTLNDESPASTSSSNSELITNFASPQLVSTWLTTTIGDEVITTCNSASCNAAQGSIAGRGLLPWITTCSNNFNDCESGIQTHLQQLISHQLPITADNLKSVSAENLVISPQIVMALQAMDNPSQTLLIEKLAEEIATQRVLEKAVIARHLLLTGSQTPLISSNAPAQILILNGLKQLDDAINQLQQQNALRKSMLSETLSAILTAQTNQQNQVANLPAVNNPVPIMQNSAIPSSS